MEERNTLRIAQLFSKLQFSNFLWNSTQAHFYVISVSDIMDTFYLFINSQFKALTILDSPRFGNSILSPSPSPQ